MDRVLRPAYKRNPNEKSRCEGDGAGAAAVGVGRRHLEEYIGEVHTKDEEDSSLLALPGHRGGMKKLPSFHSAVSVLNPLDGKSAEPARSVSSVAADTMVRETHG